MQMTCRETAQYHPRSGPPEMTRFLRIDNLVLSIPKLNVMFPFGVSSVCHL